MKNHTPIVLSADDDDNAGILLKRAFEKSKVKADLYFVPDGEEAICYLTGEGKYADRKTYPFPDLFLLDLKMPKLTGLEVLEQMRSSSELPRLPVVMLSSSALPQDIERAKALGCTEYLVKPPSFDELVALAQHLQSDFLLCSPIPKLPVEARPEGEARASSSISEPESKLQQSINVPDNPEIFRQLVEQIKDYAIFMLDPKGFILSWSEGARRIKGYEAHEIIGKHFSKFYPISDIENEKPSFELAMATETGRYEEEGWRLRKDGTRFWANVVITAIRGKDGELAGFAKVTRDLTQRKFQEDNLQRLLDSEERFRLLVEQVKDYAIFILDARGNIISWNQGARRINGYTADEVIGKHFSIFYSPEDIASDKPARELSLAVKEGHYEEENWRVRNDGTRFWASVVITSIWDKRGNLSGFAKVTRDLSERKHEEEALRQKTSELEAFAHTLSHDLRSPLRSILGFADILKMESCQLSEDKSMDYLNKITEAASVMSRLIDDILAYSRVSAGSNPMEPIPLSEIVSQIVFILDTDIKSTKADIRIEDPLPIVQGNRTLLLQVFSNLIGNAIKFVSKDAKPKIEVSALSHNGEVDILVKDHGIGIAPEHQQRVFNVFEQLNPKSNFGGTGVGLAIVKKAVERMGGSIRVESRENEGSTFVVTLLKGVQMPPKMGPKNRTLTRQ